MTQNTPLANRAITGLSRAENQRRMITDSSVPQVGPDVFAAVLDQAVKRRQMKKTSGEQLNHARFSLADAESCPLLHDNLAEQGTPHVEK